MPTTPPSNNHNQMPPPPQFGYYPMQMHPMYQQQQQYMQWQHNQQQYQQQQYQQYQQQQYQQQQYQQPPQQQTQQLSEFHQQEPRADVTDPSQASPVPLESSSSTPVPEKISTSSPNPIPPSGGASPIPVTSLSSPSSPIQFSKIISVARENLITPIARKPSPSSPSAFTPTLTSTTPTFKIISTQMREFKKFPSMESRLEVWCKCDFCKFFAMNGVQSNPKDMKMLIIDKEITFLSYLFRMPCKCGSKSAAGCTHPKLNTSMFYSHEEDNDPFPGWLEEDCSNRCTLFHCWNSR